MKNPELRHLLATVAYRFKKVTGDMDNEFGDFYAGEGVRTPNELLHHILSLGLWACAALEDREMPDVKTPPDYRAGVKSCRDSFRRLDNLFEKMELGETAYQKLCQGPLSDILTHVGQISMLRKLAGNQALKFEDYSVANVHTGWE